MSNSIKIRRSAVPGAIPATAALALGELALNTNDGLMFMHKLTAGVDSIVAIGAGGVATYPPTGIPSSTGTSWGSSNTTSGSGSEIALTHSPVFVTPTLGTPVSGNLTNCSFPTLNQNSSGSSGSTTGNAATATNVAYTGLTGTVPTWNQNSSGSSGSTTGNAATATNVAYTGLTGTVPTWNQNTTGTSSNVTGTVAIANGGTGAITAPLALTALGAYPASNPSGFTNNTFGTSNSTFRNRIINGSMVLDQRHDGNAFTPGNQAYSLDRYQAQISQTGKFSVQQFYGSYGTQAATGLSSYLSVVSLGAYAVAVGDYINIGQPIEGSNIVDFQWGTGNAKTVTLSFWAYSSLTGTFGGVVSAGGQVQCFPFAYSLPSANTWTYITITIPGPTSGTFDSTVNVGLYVKFALGVGSGYWGTAGVWSAATQYLGPSGVVNVLGTSGAIFNITGLQLELGSKATPFELRPYSVELDLCMRYCEVWLNGSGGTNTQVAHGISQSTTTGQALYTFKVPKKKAAALTYSAVGDFIVMYNGLNSTTAATALAIPTFGSIYSTSIQITTAAVQVANQAMVLATNGSALSKLIFQAEL